MMSSSALQDQMLKTYIDSVFDKYDTDRSGGLDEEEMTRFFNDLFRDLNINASVTRQNSREAIKSIDLDGNGTIDRHELFEAFKLIMNKQPTQQVQQPSYNGYNSYNNSNNYQTGYGNQPYPQNNYAPNQQPYNPNPNYNQFQNGYQNPNYSQYGYQNPNYSQNGYPSNGYNNNQPVQQQYPGNNGSMQNTGYTGYGQSYNPSYGNQNGWGRNTR